MCTEIALKSPEVTKVVTFQIFHYILAILKILIFPHDNCIIYSLSLWQPLMLILYVDLAMLTRTVNHLHGVHVYEEVILTHQIHHQLEAAAKLEQAVLNYQMDW